MLIAGQSANKKHRNSTNDRSINGQGPKLKMLQEDALS